MRKGLFDYVAHDCRSMYLNEYKNIDGCGDLVECCNCGEVMLVDIGSEDCPLCEKKGCLKWADEDYEEWDGTEENLTLI
jgi:hypothetical protein